VEANARLFTNTESAGETTATGGELNVMGNLDLGRRAGLFASLRAANDSAVLFGAFGPTFEDEADIDVELDPPDVTPPQGIVEERWYSVGGMANAYRNWSPRQRTLVQYTQLQRRPAEGDGLDSDLRQGLVRHDWSLRPNTGFLAQYRFEWVQQDIGAVADALAEPLRVQTAEGGFRYEHRISPIRTFSVSLTAGVANVLSVATPLANIDGTVEPTGAFTASYTLTQRWLLSANVTRGVTVLQGIAFEPFANNLAAATVTGVMARRVTLVANATALGGRTRIGLRVVRSIGRHGARCDMDFATVPVCGLYALPA
jgi:hypothetical protein